MNDQSVIQRLGGRFLCLLTLLVVGLSAMAVANDKANYWEASAAIGVFLGIHGFALAQSNNTQALKDHVSNVKADLRLFHLQNDNDLRTHIGRLAEGINTVSKATTEDAANKVIETLKPPSKSLRK